MTTEQGPNRPDIKPRDKSVLLHDTGPSGWLRRHDHTGYKKGRSEHDFHDQHDRFFDPGDDVA